MDRRLASVVVALSAAALFGCQKSAPPAEIDSPPHNIAGSTPGAGDPAARTIEESLAKATADPASAMQAFLNALREGDDAAAARLLTRQAREETAKRDLVVKPPGSKSAVFHVGDVDYVSEARDGAHVHSTWIDRGPLGESTSMEIVWILRRETGGWRVAGMATRVFESDPAPLVLNFEDPDDMMARHKEAEQEIARRQGEMLR
jgi:hypothetical protein